jgi:hypothetical protein
MLFEWFSPANVSHVTYGSFYSFGFVPAENLIARPSFSHKVVRWELLSAWHLGSKNSQTVPYQLIIEDIRDHIESSESVIWIPLRAIFNSFGDDGSLESISVKNPAIALFEIYAKTLEIFFSANPSMKDNPIVVVSDYRTQAILQNKGVELTLKYFGAKSFYILQEQDVRFDFVMLSFVESFPCKNNYVLCGSSGSGISLIGQGLKVTLVVGYDLGVYRTFGATPEQLRAISDVIVQKSFDSLSALCSSESKLQVESITFKKIENCIFIIGFHN